LAIARLVVALGVVGCEVALTVIEPPLPDEPPVVIVGLTSSAETVSTATVSEIAAPMPMPEPWAEPSAWLVVDGVCWAVIETDPPWVEAGATSVASVVFRPTASAVALPTAPAPP
jgi:hypothetical protein